MGAGPGRRGWRAVVSYGDDRTERWLTGESADLHALVDQVLGPVLNYDAAHGSTW